MVAAPEQPQSVVRIDPKNVEKPLPHVWEECVGSDRAVVGLREQWLKDLGAVHTATGMKSVRFHGLFNDEMGVWPAGSKVPNFLYVDMIFDAMLAAGVRPFVELSFMPGALASGPRTALFYRGNVTLPKQMSQWGTLIEELARHCIERYGIDEVRSWNFEVWNEPNLVFFWAGNKEDYFALYKEAANRLKGVNPLLRVGGPSTARAAWIDEFLEFCATQSVPLDFISTHVYPDDSQDQIFGEGKHYSFEEVIPRALQKVKGQIARSQRAALPLYITEWSSQNPAFIVQTLKSVVGLADIMSYWTFDSVYEELGIPKTFMNGTFGLIGLRGVPRPSFYTFSLLRQLGNKQITCDNEAVWATLRDDGSLAVLVWNLIPQPPGKHSSTGDPAVQTEASLVEEGASKQVTLQILGRHRPAKAFLHRVDGNHGSARLLYKAMGNPAYPSVQQIEELTVKSKPGRPEQLNMSTDGKITIVVPANGIALLEIPMREGK